MRPGPSELELASLLRYWIASTEMRERWDEIEKGAADKGLEPQEYIPEALNAFHYMAYSYASTYVVVEGWLELGLSDERVFELLADAGKVNLVGWRLVL